MAGVTLTQLPLSKHFLARRLPKPGLPKSGLLSNELELCVIQIQNNIGLGHYMPNEPQLYLISKRAPGDGRVLHKDPIAGIALH
jgi:hypothetical protein